MLGFAALCQIALGQSSAQVGEVVIVIPPEIGTGDIQDIYHRAGGQKIQFWRAVNAAGFRVGPHNVAGRIRRN